MEKKHFFDNPSNVKRVIWGLYVFLFLLVIADPFVDKHPYFGWEEYPSFFGTYGLVACIFLVLGAKYILRPIVMRKEGYYD